MYDYDSETETPWYGYREMITSVIVEDDVTSVGTCAFRSLAGLKTVTLGADVTVIGDYAFDNCENLESINYLIWSHTVLGISWVIHNSVTNLINSTWIITTANCLRYATLCFHIFY